MKCHHSLLLALFCSICGCSGQAMNGADADYQRQVDEYDRQAAISELQLDRTDEQLDLADQQLEMTDKLQQRRSEQADRYDVLLER
jgi:hypothetical protein